MMKKTISLLLCIVLVFGVAISVSAMENPKISRQELESYEKASFFTVMPEKFRKEVLVWYDHLYPLLQYKDSLRFLRSYYIGETAFYFDWETPVHEILEQETQKGDLRVFSWIAFADSAFEHFMLTSNAQEITNMYTYSQLPDFSSWLTELRSIDKYMVFENEICTVREVFPVVLSQEGRGILFFYFTDHGDYVKCFLSDWVHNDDYNGYAEDVILLFTLDEFYQVTKTLYSELRVEWAEKVESGNIPIGGPPTDLKWDMKDAGMELPICEAGNPIPAHLQAEIDGLRKADEKEAAEPTDTADKTSDTDPVTDVPVDEGAENVTDSDTKKTTETEENPSLTDSPVSADPSTDPTNVPVTPDVPAPFPWLWVILPAAAVLVGGVVAAVLIRKKKKA